MYMSNFFTAGRVRNGLDIGVTLAMGTVAVVLLWRLLTNDVQGGAQERDPVEDILKAGLSTTIQGAVKLGQPAARVVMVAFSDFQCPYCAGFERDTFDQIKRQFISSGEVEYAFRHLPLTSHPFARDAALAASCAGNQNRFWEMHTYLFAHQADLGKSPWLSAAAELKLTGDSFEDCLARRDQSQIDADVAEASRLGMRSTPSFVLGRKRPDGTIALAMRISGSRPFDVFRDALTSLVKASNP